MRTLRSVFAIVSTIAVMACQTAAASARVTPQAPSPAGGTIGAAAAPTGSQMQPVNTTFTQSALAQSSHRKTWIIVGVLAAIAVIAIIVAGSSGSDSIY